MKHRNFKCKVCVEVCCVGMKFFLYFPPPCESKMANTPDNEKFLNFISQLYLLSSTPKLQRDFWLKISTL
jgi:hypothetical protein